MISADAVPADPAVPGQDKSVPVTEGDLEHVSLTAQIDRPSDDAPAPASGSGNYEILMHWHADHLDDLQNWTFTPTSTTCVDNQPDTRHVDVIYPEGTGGRGWPYAATDYVLQVNNSGDCFWKYSTMEFRINVGSDYCDYKVEQIGPRTFTASSTLQSFKVKDCDASGGINGVRGYIIGPFPRA
jgi:hypothetical protein